MFEPGLAISSFDRKIPSQIWTGQTDSGTSSEISRIHPEQPFTHSWAGRGRWLACLANHGETDAPTGTNSPSEKLAIRRKITTLPEAAWHRTLSCIISKQTQCSLLGTGCLQCRRKMVPSGMLPLTNICPNTCFYRSTRKTANSIQKAFEGHEDQEGSVGLGKMQVIPLRQCEDWFSTAGKILLFALR